MSDLETLKAQHPDLCMRCGACIREDLCTRGELEMHRSGDCPQPRLIAALLALVQQHEATTAELRNNIRAEYARDLKADLAAAQATNRDLENQLAAARRHCPDHDHRGEPKAHNCGHCLAEAQATIQQQARELEEVDKALVDSFTRPTASHESHAAYLAALARQSARAQQAEAKKGE